MNREDLDRWEKLGIGSNTDTSWCVVSDEEPWMEIEVCCPSDLEQARRNAAFIAEARTAMPALIAFVKVGMEAERELRAVRSSLVKSILRDGGVAVTDQDEGDDWMDELIALTDARDALLKKSS
jgi:hypothetical protein